MTRDAPLRGADYRPSGKPGVIAVLAAPGR